MPVQTDQPVTGRTAVVTGAAGGIGAATAHRLAEVGTAVVLVDLAPHGETVAERIRDAGGRKVRDVAVKTTKGRGSLRAEKRFHKVGFSRRKDLRSRPEIETLEG